MRSIALRRLRILPVSRGAGLLPRHRLVVLAELARLGFTLANPERLDEASEALLLEHRGVMETLRAMRGGDVDYVPLFAGFPDQVPDEDEYFARRVIGYLGNAFDTFEDGPMLDSGVRVPAWLFELRAFGADPITQMQDRSLWQRARDRVARRFSDRHVEWIELELVWVDESMDRLRVWLLDSLYARSSIKEALHHDLAVLLAHFGAEVVDVERIVMKENLALVLRLLWESGDLAGVARIARTPTDVLRMFAALTGSDISLARPIRFPKLTRAQRKTVLGVLDAAPRLPEDLQRYRGLWKALGRYLHPGEYQDRFPRAGHAFDALRNGKIVTFDATTEALMRGERVGPVLDHLSRRPGVLGRKIHELLRRFPAGAPAVLDALQTLAADMPVKNLLVLRSYFATIDDAAERVVINKRGAIKVLPNNARGALDPACLAALDEILEQALLTALGRKDSWEGKTVWIDPQLARITVPLQQRAASDGVLTFGRGSRLPLTMDRVLRLFVYWKQAIQRTDLDLSLIQFGEDFGYLGHVSYTRLASDGIVHSGDLQSAPHGAAELIDVPLRAIPQDVRYLAGLVYRFAGDAFADMTCRAGWMMREDVDARYQSFDVKTVVNKVDLTGRTGYCLPVIIDLHAQEAILTDLYLGGRAFHNRVESSDAEVSRAARAVADFVRTRPTLASLAALNARARGGQSAAARQDADITFGVRGCDYDAVDTERILAELL